MEKHMLVHGHEYEIRNGFINQDPYIEKFKEEYPGLLAWGETTKGAYRGFKCEVRIHWLGVDNYLWEVYSKGQYYLSDSILEDLFEMIRKGEITFPDWQPTLF